MLFASFACLPVWPRDVDGIELRLDLFTSWNLHLLKRILNESPVPIMFTMRGCTNEQILSCLALKPTYFDLEWDRDFTQNHPETKFILSYHNFTHTPEDLESIYLCMKKKRAFGYKIACFANSTNDALRMLLLSKKYPDLSAICMGEKGQFARVLGPVVGNLFNYASVGEKTAPGQLTVSEMVDIYRYHSLNQETALYGLIGDPVEQSGGHLYHNSRFETNAVYVKMCVKKDELPAFFPLAEQLGFKGLSVTMPLKQAVIPFVDTESDTVNTIGFDGGKRRGISTDGKGAIDAIGDVSNRVILILGAGGAALSIARVAENRGAIVWIHNRTERELEYKMGIPDHYDIVINCTPNGDASIIRPGCVVMDIVYVPRETPFIKKAKELGCKVIYGEEMFFNQAALQRQFWKCDPSIVL